MSKTGQNTAKIQETLEKRILHGISCEWEEVTKYLSPSYKKMMRKPVFNLKNMENRLGGWYGEKREIAISSNFVMNHSWDAVCEVLRHEMAHQFAEEVLGAGNEVAHGESFKESCRLLRANPKASGDYPPLDDRIFNNTLSDDDKIIKKVKKLMALAESNNRHEAEAAMTKAHALILKYNIDLISNSENRDFISMFVGKPALRHFREEYHLARLLIDFYFVDGIWVPAYVIKKEKMGRVLEISGTPQNVQIAGYVYDYVNNYIHTKWDKYNKNKRLNRFRRTDFAVGIIEGFMTKLKRGDESKKSCHEQYSLIKKGDPLLKGYMKYMYPHTKSFNRGANSQDEGVLNAGKKAGKKMIISKGITKRGKNKGLLIGYDAN